MAYRIAGIDVHKRMLAVVVADVAIEGEYHFERRVVGTSPDQLRTLAEWLVALDVEEVVMESTAQYWRPVWEALERYWTPRRQARPGDEPTAGRRCGKRWSSTGGRSAWPAWTPRACRARCISPRRNRIGAPVGGRRISRMRNDWSNVSWPRN